MTSRKNGPSKDKQRRQGSPQMQGVSQLAGAEATRELEAMTAADRRSAPWETPAPPPGRVLPSASATAAADEAVSPEVGPGGKEQRRSFKRRHARQR